MAVRVAAFAGVAVRTFPDTQSYLEVARRAPWSLSFLASERAWTVPLLYKLPTDGARAWGQLAVSVVCWLALAAALASSLRSRRTAVAGFAAVLVFSSSTWIVQWDRVLLSESVSLSLTAGVLALWLVVARRPTWPSVAALLAATTLWVFVRDTNAFIGLVAVPALLVWAARRPAVRARALVLTGGIVALLVASGLSSAPERAQRNRWLTPMLNVLGRRVLVDEDRTAYFAARGLRLTPALRAQTGALAGVYGPNGQVPPPMWEDPGLEGSRLWVRDHMRGVYAGYLASHPGYVLAPLAAHRDQLLAVQPPTEPLVNYPLSYYRPEGARAALPGFVDRLVFPRTADGVLVLAALVAAGAVVAQRRRRLDRSSWVLVLVLAVTPAHLLLVWHGDPGEFTRHALEATVGARLGLVLLAALVADAIVSREPPDDDAAPVEPAAPAPAVAAYARRR